MNKSAIVFLDTETLGFDPDWHPIWEIAGIRREVDGTEREFHRFVEHDASYAHELPEPFLSDYRDRYDPEEAVPAPLVIEEMGRMLFSGRPHVVGAVPNFDTERIALLRRRNDFPGREPWHYHLIDIENLAVGYLRAKRRFAAHIPGQIEEATRLPWDSNKLSAAVGVDPEQFVRHTAMGDVLWARAIWDKIMGVPGE